MPAAPHSGRSPVTGWRGLPFMVTMFIYLVISAGVLVIAGWQFNIELLKRPIPRVAAMNPLTALCFLLQGVAIRLIFRKHRNAGLYTTGMVLLWISVLAGILDLSCEFFHSDWQIDQQLFAGKIASDTRYNLTSSMAANTSSAFILSGISIRLLSSTRSYLHVLSHWLIWLVCFFGFFSLTGYLYQAPEFYDLLHKLPMAIHTAACFIILSFIILFIEPGKGLAIHILSVNAGGRAARLLLSTAFILPVFAGLLCLWAYQTHVFSIPFGYTMLIVLLVIFLCVNILFRAISMNLKDRIQKEAEQELKQQEDIFKSMVLSIRDYAIFRLDVAGNIVSWNKGAETIKGYSEEEVKGQHISIFYTREDQAAGTPRKLMQEAARHGHYEMEGWRVKKDGTRFWADVVLTALYDENGILTGYSKVTRNTTESKKAKDTLSNFNEELGRLVIDKTRKLRETTDQLRSLTAHLQTAREDERKRIAREIHDELGQMLTGLRMDVFWIRKKQASSDPEFNKRFEGMVSLLNEARQTMHRISANLHPAVLNDLGLVAALEMLFREYEVRSGIAVEFTAALEGIDDLNLDADLSIGIYRVSQESLTNIYKHSRAAHISAYLKQRDGDLVLCINDDGTGFELNTITGKRSLGLLSMRERAIMMKGKFDIHSIQGEGTTILLTVPVKFK